jgi:hypothetical protein
MPLAHHPGVDIAAIEEANGQFAPISITAAGRTIHNLAADPIGERTRGRPARPGAVLAPAGLRASMPSSRMRVLPMATVSPSMTRGLPVSSPAGRLGRRPKRTPEPDPEPTASANAASPRVVYNNLRSTIG